MKATLEYNFPEDREDFDIALKAASTMYALDEFDNWMRNFTKYQDRESWPDVETVRTKFWELMRGNG